MPIDENLSFSLFCVWGGGGYAIWKKAVHWHKLKMKNRKTNTFAPNGDNFLNLDKSIFWHLQCVKWFR